jgi:hypothetical protein
MAKLLAISGILVAAGLFAFGDTPSPELFKLMPLNLGQFHQLPSMRPLVDLAKEDGILNPDVFSPPGNPEDRVVGGEVVYLSPHGEKLTVESLKTRGDSDAYSILTLAAKSLSDRGSGPRWKAEAFSTASVLWPQGIAFVRGSVFVRIEYANLNQQSAAEALELARLLAEPLDKGEGEIPVLLKHLPDWQVEQPGAVYAVNVGGLRGTIENQPILNEISFEGGTEAVVANYGAAQLLIAEFTTPQLAGDSDRRILPKIQELRSQGQPSPSAYRRVGNYSVFVFNAADEPTANQLIDQVKYEQVVQWLGENPHWYEKALREWTQTSAGVFVAVVETSGLSLLLCLGIGGLIGALVFRHRRSRQREAALYSDAGGMVRLNLDEMTAGTAPKPRLTDGRK